MSAADELERMADDFHRRYDTCVGHAHRVGERAAEYAIFMAKADAFLEVETALRERCRKLRTKSTASRKSKQ